MAETVPVRRANEPKAEEVEEATIAVALAPAGSKDTEHAPAYSADKNDLYEVLVDQWGYMPAFMKGDLITSGMCSMYDVDWALKMGTVRRAPEYAGRDMRSTTEALV